MTDHDSIVSSDKIKAVADAIREKTHKDNLMTLDEMPNEIASISGGGGTTPECGIVPTSWSSNGFVLSADSYGDVQALALSYQNTDSASYEVSCIDFHDYSPESHTIITESDDEISSAYINSLTYAYITNLTFQTVPTIISACAFCNCCWLDINELPEGITHIGDQAFYNCYNLSTHIIPSTVEYIGDQAFYHCQNKQNYGYPYYSDTATYNPGDIVNYNGTDYTCIVAVTTPESFDYSKWIEGEYPAVVGEYNSGSSYHTGDVVDLPLAYDHIRTVLKYTQPEFVEGNFPQTLGYMKAQHYNVGDVISTDSSDDPVFTCYREITVSDPSYIDYDYWVEGYAPTLLGEIDDSTLYHVGDCAYHSTYRIATCVEEGTGYAATWLSGYYPEIVGSYDPSISYTMGQVVYYAAYSSAPIFTCKVNATTPGDLNDSDWLAGYYPELIGEYDNTQVYNHGDVIYTFDDVFTCIYDNTVGHDPNNESGDGYWISGSAPDILGMYDPAESYSIGDVVATGEFGSGYGVIPETIVAPNTERELLLVGYIPNLSGIYDSSHTYYPGDLIVDVVDFVDPSSFTVYMCISPDPISGDFDQSQWLQISGDDYKWDFHKLIFRGTPDVISYSAFEYSKYNVALVPWSQGEGPSLYSSQFRVIIYDYHPEQSNS